MKVITAKDSFISEVIPTTTEVLTTMCGFNADIKRVEELGHGTGSLDTTSCLDITGMLGFSASTELVGSILMTFRLEVALAIVGGMLGCSREEAKYDVIDGMGEFVNIVTGSIKTKLQVHDIDLHRSIPNIVTGIGVQISAPESTSRKRIDFESKEGPFFFEVAFKEN